MSPLIASVVCAVILMMIALFVNTKRSVSIFAIVLMFVLLCVNIYALIDLYNVPGRRVAFYNNHLELDMTSQWLNTLIVGLTLYLLLLNYKSIEQIGKHVAEYYALIFFTLCGAYVISGFGTLLMLFLGIEILSIPQYILAGSDKKNLKSSEAALKYYLMGAFTTGIMVMGITLLYGAMGTFYISEFDFSKAGQFSILGFVGVLFIIIALGFKVSAAPMHFWTPDVYDGAPTPITSFMATIAKVAVFVGFINIFLRSFHSINQEWKYFIVAIIVATLLIGNLTALYQQSIKRMLAYSSIAHAGFMLFAILAGNQEGLDGIIIYTFAYSVATIGLFFAVWKMKDYTYDGFNGLAKREPYVALVLTIFLSSLAGIPLTAGFFAKFYVLKAALIAQPDLLWLIVLAMVMALVSLFYYYKLIMSMYFKKGQSEFNHPYTWWEIMFLTLGAAGTIIIGVAPDMLLWVK